jgi:hypothetical protein
MAEGNPYKNKIRNLVKKLADIEKLESSGAKLDDSQREKVKSKKDVQKELTALETQSAAWEAQQAPPPAAPKKEEKKPEPKKAAEPKQAAPAKEEKKAAAPAPPKEEKKAAAPAPAKEEKKAAPAKEAPKKEVKKEEPVADLGEANPFRNQVRNTRKKIEAIQALEAKAAAGEKLDEAQRKKVGEKKKLEKELAALEESYNTWTEQQKQALLQTQEKVKQSKEKPKEQPKAEAKQEKKPQQQEQKPKAQEPAKKQAEAAPAKKADKPADKPAEKKAPEKAKEPAKKEAPKRTPTEEDLKPYTNKIRNLKKKLDQIELLKKEKTLDEGQKEKVKQEKSVRKELEEAEASMARFVENF